MCPSFERVRRTTYVNWYERSVCVTRRPTALTPWPNWCVFLSRYNPELRQHRILAITARASLCRPAIHQYRTVPCPFPALSHASRGDNPSSSSSRSSEDDDTSQRCDVKRTLLLNIACFVDACSIHRRSYHPDDNWILAVRRWVVVSLQVLWKKN